MALRKHRFREILKGGQTMPETLPLVFCERHESAVDEINDARFASPGRIVRGKDALADGIDFNGLSRCEELEFLGDRTLGLGASVIRGSEQRRPICGNPKCRDASHTV